MKDTIFNIQHFSLHDGPGIRTTVFFKGCPLNCVWCHNPESIDKKIQSVHNANKCIRCMLCNGEWNIENAKNCPADAIDVIGYEISDDDVFSEISKDVEYYKKSDGGVTFSGGEPLLHPDFLLQLLKRCQKNNIHSTIDTCGYANQAIVEKISKYADLFLYDIKFIDKVLHKKYTGVDNDRILQNLEYLSKHNNRLFIRIPLIPNITDTDKNISEIIEFLKGINFEQINLLSFHNYAKNKYIKLGIDTEMAQMKINNDKHLNDIKNMFVSAGFKTTIGG